MILPIKYGRCEMARWENPTKNREQHINQKYGLNSVINPPRKYIVWERRTVGRLPKLKNNIYEYCMLVTFMFLNMFDLTLTSTILCVDLLVIRIAPEEVSNDVATPKQLMNNGLILVSLTNPVTLKHFIGSHWFFPLKSRYS